MLVEPSVFSLVAAGFYLVVAGACGWAAFHAAPPASVRAPSRWHRSAWVVLAILFALLFAARITGLEEGVREALRTSLRHSGGYAGRRTVQAVSVGAVLLVGGVVAAVMATRLRATLRTRQDRAAGAAVAAGAALLALIALRIISLHAIDRLLYGPVKLNWFADLGTCFVVLIAAFYYVRWSRD